MLNDEMKGEHGHVQFKMSFILIKVNMGKKYTCTLSTLRYLWKHLLKYQSTKVLKMHTYNNLESYLIYGYINYYIIIYK